MAKRIEYQIVGRYMSGKEVTGYHLQSIETGKSGKYTRDQVAFLVGRDQITNCTAQLYQDKVLLRGKGMSLEDLPVQYEDGDTRNTEQLGRIKKGTSTSQAMEQFLIVGTIKSGRNTVGYVLQNAGCGIKKFKRQQVIELAQQGKIGNARVQMYQGKPLLRGIDCNLDELPSENINVAEKPMQSEITQPRKQNEYPSYVVNLLKTFDYVAPKLGLEKYGNFLTKEDGQYRIDFTTKANPDAVCFINISANNITGCYQDMDNDIEDDESYNSSNTEYIKKVFIFFQKFCTTAKEKKSNSNDNRLITLSSLTYDSRYSTNNLTYGVLPYIVDYLAKTEQELKEFVNEIHSIGFGKSETWDGDISKLGVVEDRNNGNSNERIQEYFCNFEDGYGRLSLYLEIAKKTNAKLVIAKSISILDMDGCEISDKNICKEIREAVYKFAKENNVSVKHVINR